ncbi:MAG TPA: trypsin-like peptidase domain-containing protein [Caldilineae bacterium]|nr:trypsin-like peptidase domain-containing protein [Caldilineae bacterium]
MRYFLKLAIIGIFLTGCATAEPTATPTPPATATPIPTATSLPTDTPVPTATPTPAPLKPNEIFDLVSPSVAFIETEAATGSGVLVDGGYVVTNAHVVWPFQEVRVVFPDGSEFLDAPVVGMDLMGDLAVIGPLETDLPALALVDGEDLIIGNDVYLIGYPGEVEEFPQPTISRGLISRMREWERIGMTYFQTDAAIAGGQSGGVLVSELGDVVGISGFTFADAEFGLVASAADILPRAEGLIAGEDVDGFGDLWSGLEEPQKRHSVTLLNEWDSELFVVEGDVGTEIEIDVETKFDYAIYVSDVAGDYVTSADDVGAGDENLSFEIEWDAPYFIEVAHSDTWNSAATLRSNVPLRKFNDPQDGAPRMTYGDTLLGSLDFPGDIDVYRIEMKKGDAVNIKVESVLVDSMVAINLMRGQAFEEFPSDDDSGGGIFGMDAELTFEAPETGLYGILVFDGYGYDVGGYFISVDRPYDGAPTPVVIAPTPTPIHTDLGNMALYQSGRSPEFSIQYPEDWSEDNASDIVSTFCAVGAEICVVEPHQEAILMIVEEQLADLKLGPLSQDQYVALSLRLIERQGLGFEIKRQDKVTNANGYELDVIEMELADLGINMWQIYHVADGVSFKASFVYLDFDSLIKSDKSDLDSKTRELVQAVENRIKGARMADMQAIVDYAIASFDILDD